MNGIRPLFFIALGLFGLYAVEFSVVGILPAIVQRHGVSVAQAGGLGGLVALFAGVVAVCGPAKGSAREQSPNEVKIIDLLVRAATP